ncbi:hypothetical protein BDR26DRAFT_863778 [Obelidium mucronatum]|nr:hypothetical protein BDR26DRAFT_863778 [Obelidium mucronatum]
MASATTLSELSAPITATESPPSVQTAVPFVRSDRDSAVEPAPAYTPSTSRPPKYFDESLCDTSDDDDDDDATLNGDHGHQRREVDLAVFQQNAIRRTLMGRGGTGGLGENLNTRSKRLKKWKRTLKLSKMNWWALFLLNWDVIMSLLLLISTILLFLPAALASTFHDKYGSEGGSTSSALEQFLPLVIPLTYTAMAITAKKAYTTCTPSTNPTSETAVPPTHFLKLYNFFYLIRAGMDVAAVGRYLSGWYPVEYFAVSALRSIVALGTAGVGLFYTQLFPCEAIDMGHGSGVDDGGIWVDIGMGPANRYKKRHDEQLANEAMQYNESFDNASGTGSWGKWLVIRVLVMVFLMYYTQRLTNRLLRRLERNQTREMRLGHFGGLQHRIEMQTLRQ